MDCYRIAEHTVSVLWEDEDGKKEFYNRLGVSFFPVYFGAYELSDVEQQKIEEYDMQVVVRKIQEGKLPQKYVRISSQLYYKQNDNFCITFTHRRENTELPVLTIKTSHHFKNVEMIPHSQIDNVYSLKLLQVVFQQMMPWKNGFMMHGAAIEYKGEGIIFSGFSGSGKSTQARLWRKYRDAIVINGDSPIIINNSDGPKLYGVPWCGSSGESVNRKVPFKAVVLVKQSKKNYAEEITGDEAVLAVYTNILYFSQDEADLDRLLEILKDVVCQIRVLRLYCNMEEAAVETLEKAIHEGNV